LHPAGFAIVDIRLLSAASAETIERLLAEVARTIGGGNYLPRRAGVARLRASLDGAGGRGRTLGGCRFIHSREQVLVIRELARSAQPIELMPGESALWDHRFRIAAPAAAHRQWTIGYLGASGVAQLRRLAPELTRSRLPRRFHPFLPAAWDEDGIAAVPHLPYKREGVGAVPQIIFRPVNPLTRASFAVV
jgi:tRNA(Ile)-lysidine synthase